MSGVLGFNINDIKYYLLKNGGIVEYHELVKAFRHHLSDQNTQIEARNAFKDYVNRLATVINKESQKYLVLRPEFRDQLNDEFQKEMAEQRVQPLIDNNIVTLRSHQRLDPTGDNIVKVRTHPRVERMDSLNSIGLPVLTEPPIGLPIVDTRHRPPPRHEIRISPIVTQTKPMADLSTAVHYREPMTPSRHMSFSHHYNDDSDCPPQPPPRRRNSAVGTKNKASLERFKHSDDDRNGDKYSEDNQTDGPSQQIDKLKEIHELSTQTPGRVKERAQKIDKMASLTELKPPMPSTTTAATLNNTRPKSRSGNLRDSEETDSGSVQTLDPLRRKWIISASNCDYNSLVLCLKEDPKLCAYKDFTNGYTALHWAAKFAKPDVVKLIAGTYGVNPNMKSHGGYTPLHLAAINSNDNIMELLIHTYQADPNIRDNSGKRPAQYLVLKNSHKNSLGKHSNGVIASQPINNSGPTSIPKSITARIASESSHSNFIRIGSLKAVNKVKRMTGIGHKSWGSVESIPENGNVTKKSKKNKKNSKRYPTPERQREKDSDSDSAYGFQ